MPRQKPQIWICRSCVGFLSRREAEALAAAHEVPARTAECVHCNAMGAFVSDTTSEGRAMIDDLTFDAYAAGLRQAGYEVVLFSACCNQGRHQRCAGENLMSSDTAREFSLSMTHMLDLMEVGTNGSRLPQRCLCSCHKQKPAAPRFPPGAYNNMKDAWRKFSEPLTETIHHALENTGLTDAAGRSFTSNVLADMARRFALKEIDDEEAMIDCFHKSVEHRILEMLRESRKPATPQEQKQTRWWQFWK